MTELQNELIKLGDIVVMKDDFVFTLLMRISNPTITIIQLMNIVTEHITDKEAIEVMKNDDDYMLIVLKPKKC